MSIDVLPFGTASCSVSSARMRVIKELTNGWCFTVLTVLVDMMQSYHNGVDTTSLPKRHTKIRYLYTYKCKTNSHICSFMLFTQSQRDAAACTIVTTTSTTSHKPQHNINLYLWNDAHFVRQTYTCTNNNQTGQTKLVAACPILPLLYAPFVNSSSVEASCLQHCPIQQQYSATINTFIDDQNWRWTSIFPLTRVHVYRCMKLFVLLF